ncbi:type II toxin-antitoxin system death-on-curing family toxin [Modestobacter sp. KNN46-3]|uniref:type II toxin-antitoxin system death-on-curing family toxin n=1 Tax=Modestobacter sp. KNN46-3 TaxID=2711218 RepID=UPI0013DFDDF4|nr:type II toxin-antitoxin system death-on-curing family toxin [Modestobacter sp. KNN46-3]
MAAKSTVAQLAAEAGLDLDEALVTLWDLGIDNVLRPTDPVPASHLSRARTALGLASKSQLNSVDYWKNRLDLADQELRDLLERDGLRLGSGARTLPKGGVAIVRRYERQGERVVDLRTVTVPKAGRPDHVPQVAPPLVWRTVGRPRDLRFLSEDEVRAIHQQLFDDFEISDNPIDTPGTRSDDLLSSACARPQTSSGDQFKYPTVEMAASALAHSLANNHAFWNGNKRTALVAYLVFLDEHGFAPTCDDEELFRFILRVAQHRLIPREWPDRADREVLAMAEWTRSNTRAIARGERIIKWHRLRRVLSDYGCVCEQAKNVGNRMNITRVLEAPGRFGFGTRRRTLRVQVGYGDDGREVDRNSLRHLRSELELDEDHGVDSSAFYDGDPRPVGEFILQYRRILRRLARL